MVIFLGMRYPLFIIGLILMALFGSIGTYLLIDSRNISTITLTKEQEPELDAKVVEIMKRESGSGIRNSYDGIRDRVLKKEYTQHSLGPPMISPANGVAFSFAVIGLVMVLSGGAVIFLDILHIPEYMNARRKYLEEKTRSERVILDELIELQRKISRVED